MSIREWVGYPFALIGMLLFALGLSISFGFDSALRVLESMRRNVETLAKEKVGL